MGYKIFKGLTDPARRPGSARTALSPGSPSPGQSCSAGWGCASASWSQWRPDALMSGAGDTTRSQLAVEEDTKTQRDNFNVWGQRWARRWLSNVINPGKSTVCYIHLLFIWTRISYLIRATTKPLRGNVIKTKHSFVTPQLNQSFQRPTNQQESCVHNGCSVQHSCHQNVVTGTVHERHVSVRKKTANSHLHFPSFYFISIVLKHSISSPEQKTFSSPSKSCFLFEDSEVQPLHKW